MSFSPIKYESKILSNLASMLNVSEKTDTEIMSEIKEEKEDILFEIDEDIKRVINVNKINCTCNESKRKMDEYKGKKFEYYYSVETYGVDFFLDICNALCRSNYKPFLTEEGKNEVMSGLRIRRNSNLYKYVSFFLSKERLNRERLSDGKTPENIFHCFKCLKSVLHIYSDGPDNSRTKMYLNNNKYITEEMEDKMENDMLREKDNFNGAPRNNRDGVISVRQYKSALNSITRKSNEKIMKTIFEHTKGLNRGKDSNISVKNKMSKGGKTFERNIRDKNVDTSNSTSTMSGNNYKEYSYYNSDDDDIFPPEDIPIYGGKYRKKNLNSQNKSLDRNSNRSDANCATNFYNKNVDGKQHSAQKGKKSSGESPQLSKRMSAENKEDEKSSMLDVGIDLGDKENDKKGNIVEGGEPDRCTAEVSLPKCGAAVESEISNELKDMNVFVNVEKNEVFKNCDRLEKIDKGTNTNNLVEAKCITGSGETEYMNSSGEAKCIMSSGKTEYLNSTGETKCLSVLPEKACANAASWVDRRDENCGDGEKKDLLKKDSKEEESDYSQSDDTSYSTDDSNYKKYLRKKRKLQEQGKIIIDLSLRPPKLIKTASKQEKEERMKEKSQERLRMEQVKQQLEEKKMYYCKIEDIARKRNKRYVKTQVLSEDSKIERVYFSHKMKKFYNSKSGYFGCGWSNNRTEWTPFIHAPFFENQHNAIYKNRNKKLYEEIYDTLLHGRIHPFIRIVELKDHKHPVRLCTPHEEDCYSIVYTGKKIGATDDRVIFGEYTGFVANNRELSQEKHQYMFALAFNKKVFNDKKNVVFINEIESDEEGSGEDVSGGGNSKDDSGGGNSKDGSGEGNRKDGSGEGNSKDGSGEGNSKDGSVTVSGCGSGVTKNGRAKPFSNSATIQKSECRERVKQGREPKSPGFSKRSKELNNLIVLPDNYTYAVDSSYMFNEMSLVNHYKTCSVFNNYDFRVNAEWQLVYLDGWPHIILTSIPGVEINTGEEIFADFGFEWFQKVNDICLNGFIQNNYEHRLNKLNMIKEKYFNGLEDIIEKYNLMKNYTTCNICMNVVNSDYGSYISCSGCNHIYHLKCVYKFNVEVNENYDWFCPSCIQFSLNIINQKEFLSYIEKENHKKLIHFFSEMCIDNSVKINDTNSVQNKEECSNIIEMKDEINIDEEENYVQCFENIIKLLHCRENINDLIKNKEIINNFLEKIDDPTNFLHIGQRDNNFSFKNDDMKQFLENSYELHLLVEYKNKIEDLLVCREQVDSFLNNDEAKKTMILRNRTVDFLMQNKKYIEQLVAKIRGGNIPAMGNIKGGDDLTKVEEKIEETVTQGGVCNVQNGFDFNVLKVENKENNSMQIVSPLERGDLKDNTDESGYNFSSAYENALYSKSNNIARNLKEANKRGRTSRSAGSVGGVDAIGSADGGGVSIGCANAWCCNNLMKMCRKVIGFPLIKDFERGISTSQPSLPLNDHLKKLSVCSNCYNKHQDLAKAVICRVTKLHFESNYNDGLSEEDMFKTSSECIQSVIRELANTIKEYRKKELKGAYVQYETKSGSTMTEGGRSEINMDIIFNNSITPNNVSISTYNKDSLHRKAYYNSIPNSMYGDKIMDNMTIEHTPLLCDNKPDYAYDYSDKKEEKNSTLYKHTRDETGDNTNEQINDDTINYITSAHLEKELHAQGGDIDKHGGKNEIFDLHRNDDLLPHREDPNGVRYNNPRSGTNSGMRNNLNRDGSGSSGNECSDGNKYNKIGEEHGNLEYLNGNVMASSSEAAPGRKNDTDSPEGDIQSNGFIPLFGVELGKTKFQREFTNGTFVGTVTKQIKDEHDNNFFVVTYEDGDAEWITPSFLFQELLKQTTNNMVYPLASSFKEVFNPNFKKDVKLSNYTFELKMERKKRKSNCENPSNNNSINKRQKHVQEEGSLKKKKQKI
ncbi:hypothetical protein POVWA2_057720 [Plasmodium ovale wallikeri]|uniref:Histone-lysine N-methyltransferase, H3 lysine-4 specific n=1 Tax=Plasmodium ovale wallikeri TaxID=864142 RepID=A0A1A8ZZ32_PLAOA|nr:hypothetical protein POVWA2_057720 [Plasmodium ovale wallikeri]